MIQITELKRVQIANLFSYYSPSPRGPTQFEFSKDEAEDRNVVLVMGRNGYGKTSFLNSLKLVFLGTGGDEAIRSIMRWRNNTALPGRDLFILGIPGVWEGIINKRIRREQPQVEAHVRIDWRETGGDGWAQRTWTLAQVSGQFQVQELLEVKVPTQPSPLTDKAAQLALEERLPARYVRFYLFDGEEMQAIAGGLTPDDNNKEQSGTVKSILGVHRLEALIEAIQSERGSIGYSARVNARERDVGLAEKALAEARNNVMGELQKQQTLEDTIRRCNQELPKLQEELSTLDTDRTRQARLSELNRRREEACKQLPALQNQLLSALEKFPLLVNSPLINATIEALEITHASQSDQETQTRHTIISELLESLPQSFLEPNSFSPRLTGSQLDAIKKRLQSRLEELRPPMGDGESQLFAAMGDQSRRKILHALQSFGTEKAHEVTLAQMFRVWQQQQSIVDSLQAERQVLIDAGVQDLSQEYERKVREQEQLKARLDQATKERRQLKDLDQLKKTVQQRENELAQANSDLELAYAVESQKDVASRWLRFLDQYKRKYTASQFSSLGARMSEHWQELMTSQRQVTDIACDQDLNIHLKDSTGADIGISSLSEGMKQLAATAFLWALFDVTEHRFPVIIDTPLGRIDYGHQLQLLQRFYPKVARQVIMLPTDSELDERKLGELTRQNCIYRHFELRNDGVHGTMVNRVV